MGRGGGRLVFEALRNEGDIFLTKELHLLIVLRFQQR
jgi:hypothetical protein